MVTNELSEKIKIYILRILNKQFMYPDEIIENCIKEFGTQINTQNPSLTIKNQLKKFNVVSIRPEIVDPETTTVLLTSNVKYNEQTTAKTSDTIKSNIITTLTNFNTNNLQKL